MPDEVSFPGLAGTPDLINDYFSFELLFVWPYSYRGNTVQTSCFSLSHKGRGK